MNNVFVYCELEGTTVAEVSQELLTKGRKLANTLGVQLEAVAAGAGITGKIEPQILPYGVDKLHIFDAPGLAPYTSLPHTAVLVNLFKEEQPQICLMGADVVGRDLGPRVSSALHSGLTADCTSLEIGSHEDKKAGKKYESLLYQIRPAFGGNIVATIVNPENRPQMATVRSGVMKAEVFDPNYKGEVIVHDVAKYVPETEYVVKVIDRHVDKKAGKKYESLLYQIRPAFGGNIVATIVNPENRPQMATVRSGVMKAEVFDPNYKGEVIVHDVAKYVPETEYVVKVIDRHVEKAKNNLKGAAIVIAGGYGMGSKEGFGMLYELAHELHAEVGGSRAAVDAGFCDHDLQIGQTGVTVRPKVYIACGISGAIQHIAGMKESGIIISVNSDPNAPINAIADYVINGTVEEVVPKLIKYYKQNSK